MNLGDLSASELARIDAVCMDYESRFRRGHPLVIDDVVAHHGGEHAELLRRELELVRDELSGRDEMAQPTTQYGEDRPRDFDPVTLPPPGTRLGPYVIGEILGRGGMGVVVAARDTRLDRKVAIKLLAIGSSKRRELTERFDREARAVAAISHPNIVELFDVGVADGLPYAVMEYLDGEPLDETLGQGALEPEEVRRIGAQIAEALATAHRAGVVHRDLKPHNIMLVPRQAGEFGAQGHDADSELNSTIVKLFDFGLSRAPQVDLDEDLNKTDDGVILGTPGYMAPEQVRGDTVTPAADIFSLGCVLFEAFYGKRAFDGPNKAARFSATLERDPETDPLRRRDDVALADLIEKCLQKDPSRRPPSAAVIVKELRQGIRDRSHVAVQGGELTGGNLTRRRLLAIAGGGVAGAIAGGMFAQNSADELTNIHSLAVLSFSEDAVTNDASTVIPPPIGEASLHRGEQLAALLVHELTRLSELMVPRFRPMVAETPGEFREIGRLLEVDALLTGTMQTSNQGDKEFLEIDIQIVSARTGNQLWGKRMKTESRDNLLEQSRLATEIASVIGRRLTSTGDEIAPPSVESFSCLVDGKTRSDPDSVAGLEMALMCFQKAHDVDRGFADPIAGIALTSITLAAQTDAAKSVELVRQARERAEEAMQLDPSSIDAQLALAMLDWQTLGRYKQAEQAFQELVMVVPNSWQVRHQYGLLQLATGRFSDAARSLREASQLNPMSVLVKVDRARAQWFSGNQERALQDALWIRDKYGSSTLARGLLVDIYEHREQFDLAAAEHTDFSFSPGDTADDYFRQRHDRLSELAYGPFGDLVNEALWEARSRRQFDDLALARLTDPVPPMLPLLLAVHPAFSAARLLPRARDILPERLADSLT